MTHSPRHYFFKSLILGFVQRPVGPSAENGQKGDVLFCHNNGDEFIFVMMTTTIDDKIPSHPNKSTIAEKSDVSKNL